MLGKVEGMDYVVDGNEIYSLDPKEQSRAEKLIFAMAGNRKEAT